MAQLDPLVCPSVTTSERVTISPRLQQGTLQIGDGADWLKVDSTMIYQLSGATTATCTDHSLFTLIRVEESPPSEGGSTACCKHCTSGKPCGDTCIPVTSTCRAGPGCAC